MSTVFVSAPMTGYPDWNRPAIREVVAELQVHWSRVLSPLDVIDTLHPDGQGIGDLPHGVYLRQSLALLLQARTICLMPGWQRSSGCRTELAVALALGLEVMSA